MLQNCVHVNWQAELIEKPIEIWLERFFGSQKQMDLFVMICICLQYHSI